MFYDGTNGTKKEAEKASDRLSIAVEKSLRSLVKGTDEYKEKRRSDGVKRQDAMIPALAKAFRRVFAQQEKDIMKQVDDTKGLKKVLPSLSTTYTQLYITVLTPTLTQFMEQEGQIALDEVVEGASFVVTDAMKQARKQQIVDIATSVDSVTDEKIGKVITEAVNNGLTPQETRNALRQVFTELSTSRLDTIVRTESARSATLSQIEARQQSEVVEGKERYTSVDERTCPYCSAMHGKVIGLEKSYFKKGDSMVGTNGKPLSLHYCDTV